jgi:hypothetical protein
MNMFVGAHLHLPRMKANIPNCISVKPKLGPTFYVPELKLKHVVFKVNENGRQRVLAKRQREVHAWVTGETIDELGHGYWQEAYYSPYKTSTFINKDTGKPVHTARYAFMCGSQVLYVA